MRSETGCLLAAQFEVGFGLRLKVHQGWRPRGVGDGKVAKVLFRELSL